MESEETEDKVVLEEMEEERERDCEENVTRKKKGYNGK